jgi:multisubunit Na+/H+ antiporter MnhB subunit
MTDNSDDQTVVLREWAATLSAKLGLDGLQVDVDAILSLAGAAAHAVVRPAAPLTTYLVGYAAGMAVAGGASPDAAFAQAAAAASTVAAERTEVDVP